MQINANGRTYKVLEVIENAATAAHFGGRGFDGNLYMAEAAPVGRQRKTFTGMFLRSVKTGQFVSAL